MNNKEVGEIRRRLRQDKTNMTAVCGCFVNDKKEIVSQFRLSLGTMPENEGEKYFALFRRCLSGGLGRSLIDISFKTQQVTDSPEHKLLMALRDTELKDEELLQQLYGKIIESVSMDTGYAILLGCDNYDVPFKSGEGTFQKDGSADSFRYMICAICPVKLTKSALRYDAESKEFHDGGVFQTMAPPKRGFMFPAFDGRAANIYNALYYSHDLEDSCEDLVNNLFNTQIPMPAKAQKRSFRSLLSNALEEDCTMDTVQTVHDQLRQMMTMHKESRVPEPLMVSKEDIQSVLQTCGVEEKHISKFSVDFENEFGYESQIAPGNVIDDKKIEVKTPDVVIRVNPERSDLIETRVIGGVKYIMICADDNVEVNGVNIQITEKDAVGIA